MSRLVSQAVVLAALVAAGVGGYQAGRGGISLPFASWHQQNSLQSATPGIAPERDGPVIYYRDPAGLPVYSAAPRKTGEGRDFVSVHASEDISFESPPSSASGQKRLLYYRNPMGLPDTSPTPKKDSMGMAYIAVYASDDEDRSIVKISPGKLQRSGVRSEQATLRLLSVPIRASGTVQLDERRKSVIALRFDAYIASVADVTTGTMVRKGQPLMQIYGADLLAPAAQYVSLLGDRNDPQALKSARRRLENYGVPDEVIAQIERTREIPATLAWPSPRTGIVLERTAVDGMKASAGESLFRLADTSVVWLLADVTESDLPLTAVGQSATVKPRGSGQPFLGHVSLIYPSINMQTRTARLRIELPNPNGSLLPDMFAQVEIATGSVNPVLTVADAALIDSGDRQVVLVDKGEGRFEPRAVKAGRRGGGYVEITEGLAEGERVVAGANFLIDAESNLKAALQGLTPPGENQ